MIISRTPFRISFFGGGTDYPVWYREHGGAVLATTIDKYCYITCRWLPPFFEHRHRVVYSKIENVQRVDEIEHPSARATLQFCEVEKGIEIHHDGDLPARTGLGSSSAFTVGLLHSLYALKGDMPSKLRLATEAIHIEQNVIKENVGSQDQVLAAFGGFNRVEFAGDHNIHLQPVTMEQERFRQLQDQLLLYFTGFTRFASEIAGKQIQETPRRTAELAAMRQMVEEAVAILKGHRALDDFGKLLHESWILKRSLTDRISTSTIDEIYRDARAAGALGGKLLGAGGGGFMIFFVRPGEQPRVKEALGRLLPVPFRFENSGSQIIFHNSP